jgi:ABC-type multidrug transport system ATPase subunit
MEESDFTRIVAKEFKIGELEYLKAYDLIINKIPENTQSPDYCILSDENAEISEELEGTWISKNKPEKINDCHSIHKSGLDGKIFIVRFKQTDLMVLKYHGKDRIFLSRNPVLPNKYYIFSPYDQIYFTDSAISFNEISGIFKNESPLPKSHLSGFQISVSNNYRNSVTDNKFNFSEESGNLICLLGETQGTSKILNSLAGRNPKLTGKIIFNGYDVYSDYHKVQKYIGFVPDYPIYSSDISIYENLYYTARLTYPTLPVKQIKQQITEIIDECKLTEIQKLLPGTELRNFSPALQSILTNLAIELVRKPNILFIQSPFEPINTPDYEIILQILRTYVQGGNLAFLSSFQPNTAILRLADKLWIFDEGNYLIYNGNTTDAYNYFKASEPSFTYYEDHCTNCGTLNPELLYQIIQQKAVDENGRLTVRRKIPPEEWNKKYKDTIGENINPNNQRSVLPVHPGSLPNIDTQYCIFSKLNLLEQIRKMDHNLKELTFFFFVAIIIPLLMRSDWSNSYFFGKNPNIYPYITISILLLFIWGFIRSEKENFTIKPKTNHLQFKNLSFFSFLNSQITWWFISSLFCSFIYTAISYLILKFKGTFCTYWCIFFTICLLGNVTGILVSNCCKKRSIVYFWLLFIISFNILFNGITINTKDYPKFSYSGHNASLITDLSPVKWAIEAIAVDLAINNPYEKILYPIERKLEITMFNANHLIPAIQKKLIDIHQHINVKENQTFLRAIQTEIKLLPENNPEVFPFEFVENLIPEKFDQLLLDETIDYLTYMQIILSDQIRKSSDEKRRLENRIIDSIGEAKYDKLKSANRNLFIYNLINNMQINESVIFSNGTIIKQLNPLFIKPVSNFGRAHLFAPVKLFNKVYYSTLWFNLFVLWMFIFTVYIATNSAYFFCHLKK